MKSLHLILFSLVVLLLVGCSGLKSSKSGKPLSKKQQADRLKNEKQANKLKELFYDANKAKITENYSRAIEMFEQCVQLDSKHDASYYELSGLYAAQGRFVASIEAAKQAAEIDPTNNWYLIQLGYMYQKNGQYDRATKTFKKLVEQFPESTEYLFPLHKALILEGKMPEAIKILDGIEEKHGPSEELGIRKQQMYVDLKQYSKAISEIEKLIELDTENPKYYLILSKLHSDNDEPEKSLAALKRMQEIDPENGLAHLAMYQYYRAKGEDSKAFDEVMAAFRSDNVIIDAKIEVMFQLLSKSATNPEVKMQAYQLLDTLVVVDSAEAKAFSVYGDFLNRDQRSRDALVMYRRALKLDNSSFIIWQEVLFLESEIGDFELMFEDSKQAMDLFPTQPMFYYFNGAAEIQRKNYQNAIDVLSLGKEMVVDNRRLLAQFYTRMAEAYHNLKEHKKSDTFYDKSLELQPDQVYVLNNYSYYLSVRNVSIDKAVKMAERANELAPNTSSFMDTYGWALFRAEKFVEARKWIQKALHTGGSNSGEVLEHMGDVLFHMEKKEQALRFWEDAKLKGGGSKVLDKKIEEKKYLEE